MKKKVCFILIVTLLAAALSLNASAVLHQKQAKASYGSAEIDGKLDDAYKNSDPIEARFMSSIANQGTEDDVDRMATAVSYMLWDESNIYIYTEVTDSTPITNPLAGNSSDGIEMFFDFENINSAEASPIGRVGNYGELGVFLKTCAYAQAVGSQEYETVWIENFSTFQDEFLMSNPDCKIANVITPTGYISERRFPLNDELKAIIKEGFKFGFQIAILDDMTDDSARDLKITWGEAVDDISPATWGQSAHCDEILLTAAPEPPAPETEAEVPAVSEAAAPETVNPKTADPVVFLFAVSSLGAVAAAATKNKKNKNK
ncbi:MAG: sugar-binding protein [Eubacteriales bacterium]|nr:sugar-binding protein [Eubacteriales bacterium]